MRTFNLLLLVVLLAPQLINAASPRNFNSIPDCSVYADGTLLADPNSCASFYMCRNGRSIHRRCSRGFYFDENDSICNYASLVDCSRVGTDRIGATDNNTTAAPACGETTTACAPTTTACAPTTTACAPTTTVCAPTTTCASTTTCSTSTTCKPTPPPCTTPTTPCTTPTPPCTTPTPPCTTPTTPCTTTTTCATNSTEALNNSKPALYYHSLRDCVNKDDDTYLVDPKHCRRFYMCLNGRVRKLKCNVGQWFDYEKSACARMSEVTNCEARRN